MEYYWAMNADSATVTIQSVHFVGQPTDILNRTAQADFKWDYKSTLTGHKVGGWRFAATLANELAAYTLSKAAFCFPMTHDSAYLDINGKAEVTSDTFDPRDQNNIAHYDITPNHHSNGDTYWSKPGNLAQLDFTGIESLDPVSESRLSIASEFAYYNNNLAFGERESLMFLIFNAGPSTAFKPVLHANYAPAMDAGNAFCVITEKLLPESFNVSQYLQENKDWSEASTVPVRKTSGYGFECDLPDMLVNNLYWVRAVFPMTHEWGYKDYESSASVSFNGRNLNPGQKASYTITPNHGSNLENEAYWKTPGNLKELNVPPDWGSESRPCQTGWLDDTYVMVSSDLSSRFVKLSQLREGSGTKIYSARLTTYQKLRPNAQMLSFFPDRILQEL
ncbi:hypothetical protein ARSEF4850_009356 [Beauveria asiatica]